MDKNQLQYPIGRFKGPFRITPDDRKNYIAEIAQLPAQIREAVAGLENEQLDTPYRTHGWTIRQVVHHIPDSHLNSYVRFKWALTESVPIIKAYDEKDWASLPDAANGPIAASLNLLEGLHQRWVALFNSMSDTDWSKCFVHPETNKKVPLDFNLSLYAWHGKHHLAHIVNTRDIHGW